MEGRQRQLSSASVSGQRAGGISVGASKGTHSASPQQGSGRAGWAVVPPRSRVEKRSAADKVSGLSAHARLWLGPEMVLKGEERAAAPGNSQEKRGKENYMDCWDVMDVIEGDSTKGPSIGVRSVGRNSSAAGQRRASKGSSGFPSDNDQLRWIGVIRWSNKYMEAQHVS